ncbi:hypothetical protein H5S09_05455 [Limosilactobacillus sp. STM2_1]|uniref:DUF7671 domain-containing protein n=1 Tax=Limosilactobacillus rudii TaxID=2759755 RepID=A0A7W3YND8_9LACO|nr:hypothetical protein [Limosilactobacillus rudii]MBB1079335.1 hypothetical protein [Limosilactobacillus rudii]MBB1097381.1 hypothetical protein [Limosilactobacillus rudii]MCD7134490.1 hypothetical protein [Limosilactobacillus rudii]
MGKKDKYEVQKFTGIPVEPDASGKYQLKTDQQGKTKLHTWRTGKHTKGKYKVPGQLMLTENNLTVVILSAEPMAFKDRHSETPLQRFLTVKVTDDVLQQGMSILKEQRK